MSSPNHNRNRGDSNAVEAQTGNSSDIRAGATISIVDDDPDMRESLQELVASVNLAFKSYASAGAFLDSFDATAPGCILLDVRMPGLSGIDLQEKLRDQGVTTPIILLSGHGDIPMAVRAVQTGAFDFLEKPFRAQLLLDRINDALVRDEKLRKEKGRRAVIKEKLARLTPRERDVVDLVVAGRLNKQIAHHLGIGERTVEVHRSHAMRKLNANTAADLACLIMATRQAERE